VTQWEKDTGCLWGRMKRWVDSFEARPPTPYNVREKNRLLERFVRATSRQNQVIVNLGDTFGVLRDFAGAFFGLL